MGEVLQMEETMKRLDGAVEWLRPFAETKCWDYCVVWKLGDDPSRFVEWMGCCCSGAGCENDTVKEKTLTPLCRDTQFQHPTRTKACEALAQLPSSMPLYSGLHGEVVISAQPRWICHANASDSDTSNVDSIGTQVLIPVAGGLIELFVAKNIPKDQKIIEFITAKCDVSYHGAASACSYTSLTLDEYHLDLLSEEYLQHWPLTLHLLSSNPRIQVLPPVTQSSSYPCAEGSSSSSNPSNECASFDLNYDFINQHGSVKQSIGKSSGSKNYKHKKQQAYLVSNCGNVVENDEGKVIQKPGRERFHSKNLVTERNRRNRIKDGLYTLRALVPKITKMDKAAILGDAIEYIQELQKEVEQVQDELREMEEEDCKMNIAELKIATSERIHYGSTTCLLPTEQNRGSSSFGEQKQTEVQVEVNQMSQREFLIKFYCEQKRGGFSRLMEALNSLGLQVADANITTFCGKVLNILKVEAKKDIQPHKLRDSLIDLAKYRL